MLDKDEVEGVLAHEMSHIAHRDILIGTIAATFAGAIMTLANFAKFAAIFGSNRNKNGGVVGLLVLAVIVPIAATVIQMAVSRTREYSADNNAGRLTQKPLALANALSKISYGVEHLPMNALPSTAHMFIMNPLSGNRIMRLFSTHPSTEDRIEKLKYLEKSLHGAQNRLGSENPMFR
jgi:heat shock protein HtpX